MQVEPRAAQTGELSLSLLYRWPRSLPGPSSSPLQLTQHPPRRRTMCVFTRLNRNIAQAPHGLRGQLVQFVQDDGMADVRRSPSRLTHDLFKVDFATAWSILTTTQSVATIGSVHGPRACISRALAVGSGRLGCEAGNAVHSRGALRQQLVHPVPDM